MLSAIMLVVLASTETLYETILIVPPNIEAKEHVYEQIVSAATKYVKPYYAIDYKESIESTNFEQAIWDCDERQKCIVDNVIKYFGRRIIIITRTEKIKNQDVMIMKAFDVRGENAVIKYQSGELKNNIDSLVKSLLIKANMSWPDGDNNGTDSN